MRRYTTPTLTLTVSGVDLSDFDVYVTITQGDIELTKTDDDITVTYDSDEEKSTVAVYLTQAETGAFESRKDAKTQVNWMTSEGVRGATKIKTVHIEGNLLPEVLTYGE